ncbi:uncharacterized protein LOC131011804 isoform X2 [Salvia miltiorrhiza]|uniref:uncharacterized protein LOC131011804 isoform X2 n=1 Tax=Salvia miltiorrhiza TaxID=226208 RepID=UPI0025ACB2D3|nr:uncharacterized protein LOC131011804 isoform X2 [Salvia miltiorrhiza]
MGSVSSALALCSGSSALVSSGSGSSALEALLWQLCSGSSALATLLWKLCSGNSALAALLWLALALASLLWLALALASLLWQLCSGNLALAFCSGSSAQEALLWKLCSANSALVCRKNHDRSENGGIKIEKSSVGWGSTARWRNSRAQR